MAAFKNEKKSDVFDTTEASEYRIIVSNLRNTVTASDIQVGFKSQVFGWTPLKTDCNDKFKVKVKNIIK